MNMKRTIFWNMIHTVLQKITDSSYKHTAFILKVAEQIKFASNERQAETMALLA
jgi:hypothetical protein